MGYVDQAALAKDAVFQDRVRMAIVAAAKDVMGEVKSGGDQVYGKRQALANDVLIGSAGYVDRFAWAVAANAAIVTDSTDGDILFTVSSVWDDIAGVRITD